LDDYNRAIKERPVNLADIYNNRGNIYLSLKDTSKALIDYTRVLDIDTANVIAYTNRVGLYLKQKEMDKALYDCNRGLSIDSAYIRLYLQRAVIYEQKKEYGKAIDDYEKALELDKHYNSFGMNEKTTANIKRLKTMERKGK
jgi:tetratricopeptide (TPR) repeat protein